jgi:arylsulfatase
MKHHHLLFTLFAFSLSTCTVTPPQSFKTPPLPRPVQERPNILLFFLDDSGYGDFSHNGNPTISTPNISHLAQEGLSFTQFYVSTAACSASRFSLLTGRYPARSGLRSWVIGPKARRYLHPKELTLAEGLKSAGYATALFGKWHLGTPNKNNGMTPKAFPLAHGFDQWLGTNVSHDYDQAMLIRSDPKGKKPIPGYRILAHHLPRNQKASSSLTQLYTQETIKFIGTHRHEPFFAYIAFNQPHLGLFVGDAFRGKSRRGLLGDVMAEIDDSVGKILQRLQELGLERNTLVIFSSDNGPWLRFRNTKTHPKYGEARLHVGYAFPFRDGPWKLHIRLGSQLKTNYGFKASRDHPLLFQVEKDLGERIDRAKEKPLLVQNMLRSLQEDETLLKIESSFWRQAKGKNTHRK